MEVRQSPYHVSGYMEGGGRGRDAVALCDCSVPSACSKGVKPEEGARRPVLGHIATPARG